MKINSKEIDRQHCLAIVHEYYRCNDAFELFSKEAIDLMKNGHTLEKGYRAYNAYSSFILHLYEFINSLFARDLKVTDLNDLSKKYKTRDDFTNFKDALMTSSMRRIIEKRIYCIEKGIAPSHWNKINSYKALLPIPKDFSQNFRQYRNKIFAHVSYERAHKINLTSFYDKYHPYLYLLFADNGHFWGANNKEMPDLNLVTDFMKSISDKIHNIK